MEFIETDFPEELLAIRQSRPVASVPCESKPAAFYDSAEDWLFSLSDWLSQHAEVSEEEQATPVFRISGSEQWRHNRLALFYGMVIDKLSAEVWEIQDYRGNLTVRMSGEPGWDCIRIIVEAWRRLDFGIENVALEYRQGINVVRVEVL